MRRKILRVGRSSLAVSLPKSFLKRTNLEVSNEIDVEERGSSLIINCDQVAPIHKTINVSDLSVERNLENILDKILGALFKQGNDHFTIICSTKETADIIRTIIKNGKLGMYEDPELSNNTVVHIRSSIVKLDEGSLETLAQIIIKEIYATFEEFSEHIKNKTLTPDILTRLVNRDKIINDHADICRRIINKNVRDYQSTTLYSFVNLLEKLGDAMKNLVRQGLTRQKPLLKNVVVMDRIKSLLCNFFLSSKHFSSKRISLFYIDIHAIEDAVRKVDDPVIYHQYMLIVELIADAYSDLMVRNL